MSTPRQTNDATPFSQLTYLLRLITLLNSDENLVSGFESNEATVPVASDELGFTLLDSIAAILVQNHEVVAACYTSDKVSVIAAETDSDVIPASDVDVELDCEVHVQSSSLGSHMYHPIQLAAFSNPDFSENLDTSNHIHNVRIQTVGENLWPKVQMCEWYYAFM